MRSILHSACSDPKTTAYSKLCLTNVLFRKVKVSVLLENLELGIIKPKLVWALLFMIN